jgi:hypothetical protein
MVLPARDMLEPSKFPTFFRQRFKPALNFQAVPEASVIIPMVLQNRETIVLRGVVAA